MPGISFQIPWQRKNKYGSVDKKEYRTLLTAEARYIPINIIYFTILFYFYMLEIFHDENLLSAQRCTFKEDFFSMTSF